MAPWGMQGPHELQSRSISHANRGFAPGGSCATRHGPSRPCEFVRSPWRRAQHAQVVEAPTLAVADRAPWSPRTRLRPSHGTADRDRQGTCPCARRPSPYRRHRQAREGRSVGGRNLDADPVLARVAAKAQANRRAEPREDRRVRRAARLTRLASHVRELERLPRRFHAAHQGPETLLSRHARRFPPRLRERQRGRSA